MKVTQDLTAKNYLKRKTESQKDLIAAKEVEIKNLNESYNQQLKDQRIEGEKRLFEETDRQKKEIAQSVQDKQERLGAIKKDLDNQSYKLGKEKEKLVTSYQEQFENINNTWDEKFKNQHLLAKDKSETVHDQTSQAISDIQFRSDENVKDMTQKAKTRANALNTNNEKFFADQERRFVQQKTYNDKKFRSDLLNQKQEHKDKIDFTTNRQNVEVNQRKQAHLNELNYIETHHKEQIKQQKEGFDNRYKQLEESHTSLINRVQERFDNEIKNLVDDYSTFKTDKEFKAQDKFYRVTKLSPQIQEDLNSYKISVKLPKHEQENATLTAQERKLTLTLTRRFSDTAFADDGSVNKSRRSEVMSKLFDVKDIMDSSSIKREYKDGTLTFTIAKR